MYVVEALANTIREKTTSLENIEIEKCNSVIISLGGCFENFTVAVHALYLCIDVVYPFMEHTLKVYLDELR